MSLTLAYKDQFNKDALGILVFPVSAVSDAAGNIYVVSRLNRIDKLDSNLNLLSSFSGSGSESYEKLTIGPTGLLYAADSNNNRVDVFDTNTGFLRHALSGHQTSTFGVFYDAFANRFLVSSVSEGSLYSYAADETFVGKVLNGVLSAPKGLFVDAAGKIFIANSGNSTIRVYDTSFSFLFSFGGPGSTSGLLNAAVDVMSNYSSGDIIVSDTGNNRLQIFDSTGVFQAVIGTLGTANGQFNDPRMLCFDSAGNVIVADRKGSRAQRFSVFGSKIPLLDVLGNWLIAQNIVGGSSGWQLNKAMSTPTPDKTVTLYETPGSAPDIYRDATVEKAYDEPGFQVRIRGTKFQYQETRAKLQEVFLALHQNEMPVVPGNNTIFIYAVSSGPLPMGKDANDRDELVWNFRVMRER